MVSPFKISLQIPGYEKKGRYFSFRLHSVPVNEACIYKMPKRVFVISDIEGNFVSFFKLLTAAGVINSKLDWIFSDNHVVILGDCFDRGEQVTECLWLIYSLEEKARRQGGHVHFILGNHEVMNMNGDWRYIHPKYAVQTKSEFDLPTALYQGNHELWKWLRSKNIIEKIGSLLFVHAGISKEILDLNLSISDMNDKVRPWLSQAHRAEAINDELALLFDGEKSPFWYRGYYLDEAPYEMIKATLEFYKAKVIITGHTMINKVTSFYKNKVINVNTDHSTSNSEGLMISKRAFYRVTTTGVQEKLF